MQTLKRAIIILLGAIICFSCKDEDVDPFIGTWTYSNIEVTNCDNPDENFESPVTCDDDFCLTFQFKKGGEATLTLTIDGDSEIETGIWAKADGKLILCIDDECDNPYNYDFDGKNLILTYLDEDFGCNTNLTLKKK